MRTLFRTALQLLPEISMLQIRHGDVQMSVVGGDRMQMLSSRTGEDRLGQ